ncbi:MAG TPA: helix-turn-helix domain-containing protein [Opitutaceae bacterium]|jgi:predicted DNA-binding mobile mystery protein A|nr:helix-turn-helix domain-containing protein [Opitutaceae bacterium]
MMNEYQFIRLKNLNQVATDAEPVRKLRKPPLGWLRSVREGLGLSLRDVAKLIGNVSPQSVHQFEKNEATGALTLCNFERVAAAMGCRVVHVLVPGQDGQTFTELEAGLSGDRRLLEDTEHTMTLEAQDVGNIDERAKRGIRRHGKR